MHGTGPGLAALPRPPLVLLPSVRMLPSVGQNSPVTGSASFDLRPESDRWFPHCFLRRLWADPGPPPAGHPGAADCGPTRGRLLRSRWNIIWNPGLHQPWTGQAMTLPRPVVSTYRDYPSGYCPGRVLGDRRQGRGVPGILHEKSGGACGMALLLHEPGKGTAPCEPPEP